MGPQLRVPLNYLNTIMLCWLKGFQGALNWAPMMSRDASLLDSYTSDSCRFFSASTRLCCTAEAKGRGQIQYNTIYFHKKYTVLQNAYNELNCIQYYIVTEELAFIHQIIIKKCFECSVGCIIVYIVQ